jgi:hypothetical protein
MKRWERERTAAQTLEVPSRPPSLILNQTALWELIVSMWRLERGLGVRTTCPGTSSGSRCRGSEPCR